jgi:hypothetical protein
MANFTILDELITTEQKPLKIERASKLSHGNGGFSIEILHPGLARKSGDSGLGTIGRIDDANISPWWRCTRTATMRSSPISGAGVSCIRTRLVMWNGFRRRGSC